MILLSQTYQDHLSFMKDLLVLEKSESNFSSKREL
jgi:hypothetical protein